MTDKLIPQAASVHMSDLSCPCGCGCYHATLLDENEQPIARFGFTPQRWRGLISHVLETIDGEQEEGGGGADHVLPDTPQ
jgi:hypothetical protein